MLTHLHDDLAVGHHHGDAPEEHLEVLGQLLPPGIPGVHRDEEADSGIERHRRSVREGELLLALADSAEHAVYLRACTTQKINYNSFDSGFS